MSILVSNQGHLGNFVEDGIVNFLWETVDQTGASITRMTNGEVRVYKDNDTTQSIVGITDTSNFDDMTGVHACTIDLSSDVFYAAQANYSVVLYDAVVVDTTVNTPLAHFGIENRVTDITKINGEKTDGYNATLKLKKFDVENDSGDAVRMVSVGGNGNGLILAGNGTGSGTKIDGGATGNGMFINSGGTSGVGLNIHGQNQGVYVTSAIYDGVKVSGGSNAASSAVLLGYSGSGYGLDIRGLKIWTSLDREAVTIIGNDTGSGVRIKGGLTGSGLDIVGGATSGHAISLSATSGNALDAIGGGSGAAFDLRGGATGNGIDISTTDGHGIQILPSGAGVKHGIFTRGSDIGSGLLAMGGSGNGSAGIAASAGAASPNSFGMHISGTGAGSALLLDTPGPMNTGHGIEIHGGSTSGNGIDISTILGHGINIAGSGVNSGVRVLGGATGNGVEILGGATSGHAVSLSATSGNALDATGGGSGAAFDLRGGATGNGIDISTTDGHGIDINVDGTQKRGINIVTLGSTADGIKIAATSHGLNIDSASGIQIAASSGRGIWINAPNSDGIVVASKLEGLLIMSSETDAVSFYSSNVSTGSGLRIRSQGSDAVHINSSASSSGTGIVISASPNGGHGIQVQAGKGDALALWSSGELVPGVGGHGIHASGVISGAKFSGDINTKTGIGFEVEGGSLGGLGLSITSDTTSAVSLVAGGSDGNALDATGGGSGAAFDLRGGATGHGVEVNGGTFGATDGVNITGARNGFYCTGGLDGVNITGARDGINIVGARDGFNCTGDHDGASFRGVTNDGIQCQGINYGIDSVALGATGSGIRAFGHIAFNCDGNAYGMRLSGVIGAEIKGRDVGSGLYVEGGATGMGVEVKGGSTSGNAVSLSATSGNALDVFGGGITGVGLQIQGGSDGINIAAVGDAIRASGGVGKSSLVLVGPPNGQGLSILGGPGGSAAKIEAFIGGGSCITIKGSGSNSGVKIEGGSTGNGIEILGGSTSGHAVSLSATSGNALDATGGSLGAAIDLRGGISGNGVKIKGGDSTSIYGDVSSLLIEGPLEGNFPGVRITGSITGNGVEIYGGSSSGTALFIHSPGGTGVRVSTNTGDGINIDSYGTAIRAEGGGGGMHLRSKHGGIPLLIDNLTSGVPTVKIDTIADYAVEIGVGCYGGGVKIEGFGLNAVDIESVHSNGVSIKGGDAFSGVKIEGGSTGTGLEILGGLTSGDGIYCAAQGGNANGASFHKVGTGKDIDADELDGLLKLTTTVDGEPLSYAYELMMARVNGKYTLDTPGIDNITMYKRNNLTPLTVVDVKTTGRTRIS